jgi:hypothetical protein
MGEQQKEGDLKVAAVDTRYVWILYGLWSPKSKYKLNITQASLSS